MFITKKGYGYTDNIPEMRARHYYGFELVKENRYYDVNDLVLIFKNSKKFSQKINFDNYKEVIKFLKRWVKESKHYKFGA